MCMHLDMSSLHCIWVILTIGLLLRSGQVYSASANPSQQQQCERDSTKRYPVAGTNCEQFFQCQPTQTGTFDILVQSCPGSLIFDEIIQVCNFPAAVKCDDQPQGSNKPRDCSDVTYDEHTLIYTIYPDGVNPKRVICAFVTPKDAWTVVQSRFSDSTDFAQPWDEYETGFGVTEQGNYWLGLKSLHALTSSGRYRLLVKMKDYRSELSLAKYKFFSVSGADDGYRLTVDGYVETYSNAGDMLSYHNCSMFTTIDHDNDHNFDENCADLYSGGGWWYNCCMTANLNGKYNVQGYNYGQGITWRSLTEYSESLVVAKMMIQKI